MNKRGVIRARTLFLFGVACGQSHTAVTQSYAQNRISSTGTYFTLLPVGPIIIARCETDNDGHCNVPQLSALAEFLQWRGYSAPAFSASKNACVTLGGRKRRAYNIAKCLSVLVFMHDLFSFGRHAIRNYTGPNSQRIKTTRPPEFIYVFVRLLLYSKVQCSKFRDPLLIIIHEQDKKSEKNRFF